MIDEISAIVKKKRRIFKRVLPRTESELLHLAIRVNAKWETATWLSLVYTDRLHFAAQTALFKLIADAKKAECSARGPVTANLIELNREANDSLAYLKGYLSDRYGKHKAASYYGQFGIVKIHRRYVLPYDGGARKDSLALIPDALAAHGLENKTYGAAYWSLLNTRYGSLYMQALDADINKSQQVAEGRVVLPAIRKTLASIYLIVKGNYPDTYQQELRAWGFLKERQ